MKTYQGIKFLEKNKINFKYTPSYKDQCTIDFQDASGKRKYNLNNSVDKLLDHIASRKFHYGTISSSLLLLDKKPADVIGHALSFVKRDNQISFFDPNYGEITFFNFSDFKTWFKEEVINGVLNFIITTDDNDKKYKTIADKY
jgi:hypothetical protein